ncbi:alpha/beta fold hydrolase [Arthrobacter sp. 3Tela_A]|uniref:alpha/beta fold hydrolase n=1 Tax=Arthrobacter sp. 3Tela_A TaxID=3093743 RepID=UPI003BB52419
MNTTKSPIVLIAGHWLSAWAWDEVLEHLTAGNAAATALTLPGLDPEDPARTTRTLEEQAAAITDVVTRLGEPVTLVAHSGANFPVSLVLDRHPELIHRMVWVDSGPVGPGSVFLPGFPEDAAELPLPAFDELGQQASLEGLSDEVLDRFRTRAVPEPGPVLRERLDLSNDARRQIPTTLVCCSIPGAQMMELARSGHPMFAETAELTDVEILDLPTGHWPMWSRPRDLAEVISRAAATS